MPGVKFLMDEWAGLIVVEHRMITSPCGGRLPKTSHSSHSSTAFEVSHQPESHHHIEEFSSEKRLP